MKVPPKIWKRLGIVLAGTLVAVLVVRAWVVPALIVGALQSRVEGKVAIRDWWLSGSSAGVVGLALHEGASDRSPVWASADRVATDLTLGSLLRGRFSPRRVTVDGADVTLRLDAQGRLLTPVGLRSGGAPASPPVVVLKDAKVTVHQEDREQMAITRVQARLAPDGNVARLAVRSDDPHWGPFEAHGEFDPTFQTGLVAMKTMAGIAVEPRKAERIPFVPKDVWSHVVPHGSVDVGLTVRLARGPSLHVTTDVGLRKTTVRSDTLDLVASDATGHVIVEGMVVKLVGVAGRAIGGRVQANGVLDFTHTPAIFDVALGLEGINVADAPKSWQLGETGILGRLSGKVQLKAALDADTVDLSGSSGEAVVKDGSVQGIPIKSMTLVMHAKGSNLDFETKEPSASRSAPLLGRLLAATLPIVHPGGHGHFRALGAAWAAEDLVALQAPPTAPEPPKKDEKPASKTPSIRLPKAITTRMELEDVDLAQLIAKAKFLLGLPIPVPITGRLTLKADATIPLGRLHDLKGYAFHGTLTLAGASINKVDLGRLSARLDLANGVLVLSDLRGQLVDRPDGGPDNPPPPKLDAVAAEGPLPPGGFRGSLRAEVSPLGRISAQLVGEKLPVGELAAPFFPRPTPVAGLLSLDASAQTDLARIGDARAWSASGKAESVHLTYRGAALEKLAFGFDLKEGRLHVADRSARLNDQPLAANLNVDLAAPHAFDGTVDVTAWDLAGLAAMVPGLPHPSPVSGTLTAHADAQGSLAPLELRSKGEGRLGRFQAGPVPLGDVPFHWTTDRDALVVSGVEAHPFGGRLQGEARVPLDSGDPTRGSATVTGLDTARLSGAIPGGGLRLTGTAGGRVDFVIPHDVSKVDANVQLSAPDLTVQGVPAERVQASVRAHKGALTYEVSADSLGGKVKFQGEVPLNAPAEKAAATGELRAVGFTLAEVWKALGISGAAAHLEGQGAIDANLRAARTASGEGLWAHGLAEFRDLRWGPHYALGHLQGVVAMSPTVWRIEPLNGELLGGPTSGFLWGSLGATSPRQLGFDLRIDRASLKHALAFAPFLARMANGYGTLSLAGSMEETFRANAEFLVARARFAGLPLSELRAPAELVLTPGTGNGTLHVRRWTARFAGGHLRGDASVHVGGSRAFQSEVQLADIDLEAFTRLESDARRPASGKISGRITLGGPDIEQVKRYRGRVNLDLDDASLVNIPVFREIDKFLGAARGGLFEDGDLNGTIANRQLVVDMLTLEGRLAQIHATGTVGFDGLLNLEVLVSTSQIIPETGQALVNLIPGLRQAAGRNDLAAQRVSNYLSNRLLKLRVSGTLKNPSVNTDTSIVVADTALAFFVDVLKLPLGFLR